MSKPTPVEPASQGTTVPENLVGPRVFATVIDLVILTVAAVVFTLTMGRIESSASGFSIRLEGLPFVLFLLFGLAYYALMELAFHQTAGKMLLGLKIVSADQRPLAAGRILVRNFLRAVDFLPFAYLLGIIVVAASRKHQRIGDMAAGTRVVRK